MCVCVCVCVCVYSGRMRDTRTRENRSDTRNIAYFCSLNTH